MKVRVCFTRPGFFLADTTVALWIDERLGYRGSFRDGFEVWATLEPGPHPMRATIEVGPFTRERRWQLVVPAAGERLAVELRYSRLWGNFRRRLWLAAS